MPNKKQRLQNAENYRQLMRKVGPTRECPNCRQMMSWGEGHFAPPSLGEEGFFVCKQPILQSSRSEVAAVPASGGHK